jgi:hypothetical protein
MSWSLEGRYFKNCSCDTMCPCTWSGLTSPGMDTRMGGTWRALRWPLGARRTCPILFTAPNDAGSPITLNV